MTETVARAAGAAMDAGRLEQALVAFINRQLLDGSGDVGVDTLLFEEGHITSLRVLDLIAFLEHALDRKISDRAVRLANFRSVRVIARTFTSGDGVRAGDRLFTHRTDPSRFTSPVEALVRRGALGEVGPGRVLLGGSARSIADRVDAMVLGWADGLGAERREYAGTIAVGTLEQAGFAEAFPQLLAPTGDGVTAATPAVCYHCYPELAGRRIGARPVLVTAACRCTRREAEPLLPLDRLREFTMREIVVIGSREQVEGVRQDLVSRVSALVRALDLDASIEMATDPFFTAAAEGKRVLQRLGALKYELRLTLEAGRSVAAASFNHHQDHFGRRFGIRLESGVVAHSGCVAFGLERWVLALCTQHGADVREWPEVARRWLAGEEVA
jgi:acyl carrier protein